MQQQPNESSKNQSQSISERNKNETFLEVIIIKAMVKDFMISPLRSCVCTYMACLRISLWSIYTYNIYTIHIYIHIS